MQIINQDFFVKYKNRYSEQKNSLSSLFGSPLSKTQPFQSGGLKIAQFYEDHLVSAPDQDKEFVQIIANFDKTSIQHSFFKRNQEGI